MVQSFNRDQLIELFAALSEELAARRVVGLVHLAGGAAMMLAYGADLSTGDADAVYEPDGPMVDAIRAVADRKGVTRSWMNNQASVYFSAKAHPAEVVFESANLRVLVTPADHLLAMKVLAARAARDRDDAILLLAVVGVTRAAQVREIVDRYFPDEALGPRQEAFIASLPLEP